MTFLNKGSARFLLVIVLAISAVCGCGITGREKPGRGEAAPLMVSFSVNFFPVQKALWVEDAEGNYVKTLHISQWLRGFGEEFQVLTDWVEASKEARHKKPEERIDAFTEATLRADRKKVLYPWDLENWKGERVKDGKYYIILQCDGAEGVVITWKAGIEIGAGPAAVELVPEPPEHPQGLEMYVGDVFVEYNPL